MNKTLIELPSSELIVMQVIWDNDTSLTANEIIEIIHRTNDWSPKTIRTLLTRLVEKGFINKIKKDKLFIYESLIEENYYKSKSTKSFINKLYDGALSNLVLNFVKSEELSKKEIEDLKKMLDNIE